MKLASEVFGQVVVVHAPKEMIEDNADLVERFIESLGQPAVVLDLDGTESLDSAGLTMLLDVQESLRDRRGDLKICSSNETNRKVFEITRLDEHVELYESVIDAVKSFA